MHSSARFLFAAVLLAGGGLSRAGVVEDVVARVNGKPVFLSEYNKNLREALANYQRTMPQALRDDEMVKELRKSLLDQMIEWELLAQKADEKKIQVHNREIDKGINEVLERSFRVDEVTGQRRSDKEMEDIFKKELAAEGLSEETYRERIRRQTQIRKVIDEEVRANTKEPGEERAKKAFAALESVVRDDTSTLAGMGDDEAQAYVLFGRQIRNAHSERVRVAHVLCKFAAGASMVEKSQALQKAKDLKKRIAEGADFEALATKESDDLESATRGGDLGFILRGWMPPEFEKSAFALSVGEVSEPVESDFGYHLIRVIEKKAKEGITFDKLKPQVSQFVASLDQEKALRTYVKKLREKATVEVILKD